MPEPMTMPRDDDEAASQRTMDQELKAMSAILRTLDKLDDDAARSRVVTYIAARYTDAQRAAH